jgi:hypothetical protein
MKAKDRTVGQCISREAVRMPIPGREDGAKADAAAMHIARIDSLRIAQMVVSQIALAMSQASSN